MNIQVQGRQEIEVELEVVRELTEADLASLAAPKGSKPPALQRIRDSHHQIARLLASGLRPMEVCAATGYSASRLSILQNDPAFQELITFYRDDYADASKEVFVDAQRRMTAFVLDGLQELHERLLETPDEFTVTSLTEAVKTFADRSGNGPTSKSVNINIDYSERLKAARLRAGTVIEGQALPLAPKEEG